MQKSKYLLVAIQAARKAGSILMKHYGKLHSVEFKKYQDMVTVADKQAEDAIIKIIRKHLQYGALISIVIVRPIPKIDITLLWRHKGPSQLEQYPASEINYTIHCHLLLCYL